MRVYPPKGALPVEIEPLLKNGDYALCDYDHCTGVESELWIIRAPNGDLGSFGTGKFGPFTVEKHEDGTISVGPASMQFNTGKRYHGYLKKGVWT